MFCVTKKSIPTKKPAADKKPADLTLGLPVSSESPQKASPMPPALAYIINWCTCADRAPQHDVSTLLAKITS